MNADAFRYLYEYHISENRKIWDTCVTELSYAQFIQEVDYSHGSLRNQIVHLMEVDDIWFCELRGVEGPEPFPAAQVDDRLKIRTHWDLVEQHVREYLAKLEDSMLDTKPIINNEEDKDLILWQVLLHVVNHATDHRAQVLRIMHDMGIKTGSQDFIFYVYDHR